MNAQPTTPPTRRRRRGLKTLALIGLAAVGLSACGGQAFMAVNGPNFPAEHAEGRVGVPGLRFTHDEGKVVSIFGAGPVTRPDGSATVIAVDIQRKANGYEYEGTINYKLKNGRDCDWTIDDDALNVPEAGLAGVALSYCESGWSSATWRFDPT